MKKFKITEKDYIKAHRKASREAEIADHARPVGFSRVHKSKKMYNRKKMKADDKGLPLLFQYASAISMIYFFYCPKAALMPSRM